jgi:hypothetical protein
MRNAALLLALSLVGCAEQSSTPDVSAHDLFDGYVYPILTQKCSGNATGCHALSVGDLTPSPLGFVGAPDVYDLVTAPSYAGDFGNDAPLLTHHAASMQLSGDARHLVEEWLGRERLERGL